MSGTVATVMIGDAEYVQSDILLEKAPVYCKGVRSLKDFITKKNITEYTFAKLNKENIWTVSDGKSRKYDKLFFAKSFVDTIPEINEETEIETIDKKDILPEIINLEDHEKFKDENGNIIEIETRGERKYEKIFFKVKDAAVGFQIDRLQDVILYP